MFANLNWGLLASLAAVALVLVMLAVTKSRRTLCAYLLGGAGALIGVQVNNLHVFTWAVALWVAFAATRNGSRQWLRVLLLAGAVGLVGSTVFFGDLVNNPNLALSLAALAGSAALLALTVAADDIVNIFRGALVVITVGVMYGLLQVAGLAPIETWHVDVSALGRPVGIWPEPDWLGLMSAVGAVLAWHLQLEPNLRTAALILNVAGVVLSFARGTWVAVVAMLLVVVLAKLFARRREAFRVQGRQPAVVALVVVAVLALFVSPALREDLGRRIGTLTTSTAEVSSEEDASGQARIQQTEGLLRLVEDAPPFGRGLSASGRVGVSGALYLKVDSGNSVASNWVLGLWVDAAFLAIPLVGFVIFFALRGVLTAPGQALLLVLVNSLFSNAFFQPVTWLMLGLTLVTLAPRLPEAADRVPALPPPPQPDRVDATNVLARYT